MMEMLLNFLWALWEPFAWAYSKLRHPEESVSAGLDSGEVHQLLYVVVVVLVISALVVFLFAALFL